MLRTVNRVLLAVVGAVFAAAGVLVLTASWPLGGRDEPLLAASTRRNHWHAEGWWWWAEPAGLGLCVLLALWWLLAQLRRSRLDAVVVDTGDGAFAVLRGRALEQAVTVQTGAVEGVARCRAALRGRREAPTLRLALELQPYAVPADALAALAGPVLSHARTSTGRESLPTEARLEVKSHRARRVA